MSEQYDDVTFPAESVEFNDEEKSILVTFAASQGRDLIGDFLEVGGIDTTIHQRNPVAFFNHAQREEKPIGKCEDPDGNYTVKIDAEKGIATAKIFLARNVPDFPLPEQCFKLYKQRILKGGSIGFKVLDATVLPPDPQAGYFKKALHIKRCILKEVSLVGQPMNQDAVVKYDSVKCLIDTGMSEPAAATETKDMSSVDQSAGAALIGEPVAPHGAKVLKAAYGALCGVKAIHDGAAEEYDNDGVEKCMTKAMGYCQKACKAIADEHAESYPEREQLHGGHEEVTEEGAATEGKSLTSNQRAMLDEVKEHLMETCQVKSIPSTYRLAARHLAESLGLFDEPTEDYGPVLERMDRLSKNLAEVEQRIFSVTGR